MKEKLTTNDGLQILYQRYYQDNPTRQLEKDKFYV